jgi:hypothetical protein
MQPGTFPEPMAKKERPMPPKKRTIQPDAELDRILSEFETECPTPTDEQIEEWQKRHPKYREEISDLATGLLLLSEAHDGKPFPKPTPEELEFAYQSSLKQLRVIQRRVQTRSKAKNR